jgi:hypothetical protein
MNDLLLRIYTLPEPVLFAVDVGVLFQTEISKIFSVSNLVLSHVIKWFAAYHLVLNVDKTNILKFMTIDLSHSMLHVGSGFKIS